MPNNVSSRGCVGFQDVYGFGISDQWSPINTEGKKQYTRDFLMQLQRDPQSMEKPTNLPNMEIIKDNRMKSGGGGGPMGGGGRGGPMGGMGLPIGGGDMNMFMPGYVKPTISRVS